MFDAFLGRLEQTAPGELAWVYELAWLAYDKQFPAARDHARRGLSSPMQRPMRGQMSIILAATGAKAEATRIAHGVLVDPPTPADIGQSARELLRRMQ